MQQRSAALSWSSLAWHARDATGARVTSQFARRFVNGDIERYRLKRASFAQTQQIETRSYRFSPTLVLCFRRPALKT